MSDLAAKLGPHYIPFDFVVARLVLQHVSEAEQLSTVRDALALLRPGGTFIGIDSDEALPDLVQPKLYVNPVLLVFLCGFFCS